MTEALANIAVEDAVEKLITPNGKKIEIVHLTGSNLYKVRFKDGGELPEEFDLKDGRWTSARLATESAQAYLRKFWGQVEQARAKREKPLAKE